MRFIRDIISENADQGEQSQDAASEAVRRRTISARPRTADRTITRLSHLGEDESDGMFSKLLAEHQAELEASDDSALGDDNLFHPVPEEPDTPIRRSYSVRRDPEEDMLAQVQQAAPDWPEAEEESTADPMPEDRAPSKVVSVPAPAAGRSVRSMERAKTRFLGFAGLEDNPHDPFSAETATSDAAGVDFPVGWIVVVDGPGRGKSFALRSGVSQIGRGEDQTICLDFGDNSISRSHHAAIAYDHESKGFFLGQGGKANMVRLNERPVLSTEELHSGALIRIGETTLRFIAFCDDGFSWNQEGTPAHADAN
jgi:hypothetical protein